MLSTVCRKYRLYPESKKHFQQQNADEGTRHLVLGILPPYSVVAYIHWSLSMYLTMAVIVPKPNRQQTDHLSLSTTIFCRCQQTVQLPPVPKPIQLKQTISPKTAITRPKNVSKEIISQLCILCCVLCVVYHSTVLCQQSNANFQQNLIFFHKNVKIYLV